MTKLHNLLNVYVANFNVLFTKFAPLPLVRKRIAIICPSCQIRTIRWPCQWALRCLRRTLNHHRWVWKDTIDA